MSTATQSADQADDKLDRITQRIVPATGTHAPAIGAASSVFALAGGSGVDHTPEPAAEPLDTIEHARKAFQSCGELSCVQLQEALGCSRSKANNVITQLREAGEIQQLRRDGLVPIYGKPTTPVSGFKRWLGDQAASPASPPARRGRKPRTAPPAAPTKATPAAAKRAAAKAPKRAAKPRLQAPAAAVPALVPVAQVVRIQPPVDDLALGIFSTGEISIEADGQVMRLNPARARKLLDWALRVDALLAGGI